MTCTLRRFETERNGGTCTDESHVGCTVNHRAYLPVTSMTLPRSPIEICTRRCQYGFPDDMELLPIVVACLLSYNKWVAVS